MGLLGLLAYIVLFFIYFMAWGSWNPENHGMLSRWYEAIMIVVLGFGLIDGWSLINAKPSISSTNS